MIAWKLETPVCTFVIVPHKREYRLYVEDEFLQSAPTPDALADNVFTHTSEFADWDMSSFDVEDSLSAWETFKI